MEYFEQPVVLNNSIENDPLDVFLDVDDTPYSVASILAAANDVLYELEDDIVNQILQPELYAPDNVNQLDLYNDVNFKPFPPEQDNHYDTNVQESPPIQPIHDNFNSIVINPEQYTATKNVEHEQILPEPYSTANINQLPLEPNQYAVNFDQIQPEHYATVTTVDQLPLNTAAVNINQLQPDQYTAVNVDQLQPDQYTAVNVNQLQPDQYTAVNVNQLPLNPEQYTTVNVNLVPQTTFNGHQDPTEQYATVHNQVLGDPEQQFATVKINQPLSLEPGQYTTLNISQVPLQAGQFVNINQLDLPEQFSTVNIQKVVDVAPEHITTALNDGGTVFFDLQVPTVINTIQQPKITELQYDPCRFDIANNIQILSNTSNPTSTAAYIVPADSCTLVPADSTTYVVQPNNNNTCTFIAAEPTTYAVISDPNCTVIPNATASYTVISDPCTIVNSDTGGETNITSESSSRNIKKLERLHHCQICLRTFSDRSNALRHVKTHLAVKEYQCDLCNRNFNDKDNLRRHVMRHKEDYAFLKNNINTVKPYKCNDCKKLFPTKERLNNHAKIHSDPKRFKCLYCQKGFSCSSVLNRHERIHTGEKKHKCEYCNKGFNVHSDLTRHIRTHTGEKPFECDKCERRFIEKWKLIVHMKTHYKPKRRKPEPPLCLFPRNGSKKT